MNESIYDQYVIVLYYGRPDLELYLPSAWQLTEKSVHKFTSDYENPRVVRGIRSLVGLGGGEVAVQTSAAHL